MKFIAILLLGFFANGQGLVKDKPVSAGEQLEFKLSYGWFTVGKGKFTIDEEYEYINGKKCLKVDIEGKTAGLGGVFSKVDDKWGAVIEKDSFLPHYSYRDISEASTDMIEHNYFDYASNTIRMERKYADEGAPRPTEHFEIENSNVMDLMGGIMYARSIDYKKLSPGDTIRLNAYFDKEFYDFAMIYHGIDQVKTKVGKIKSYKVKPIMEKNSVFSGKDAVTFWVSADANRLPLKVAANMRIGKAYCELTSYKNVKSGIDFN